MERPRLGRLLDRRRWMYAAAAASAAGVFHSWPAGAQISGGSPSGSAPAAPSTRGGTDPVKPTVTRFQIACLTAPYSRFPRIRALQGIAGAGFQYVGWGTTHIENNGERTPLLTETAGATEARELGQLCRDMKLTPILIACPIAPEQADASKVLTSRIQQAAAAGIPQVVTYSLGRGGNRPLWVERLKQIAPLAKDHNVLVTLKPHGGELGSGKACGELIKEVNHSHVQLNYDAGSVLDLLNIDPIPDLKSCASQVRGLIVKDHRKSPRNEDCGPGLGEIDHYNLLAPVAHLGLDLSLVCENLFAPLMPRPNKAEEIDALARRAREFLELVVAGLHAPAENAMPS